MKGDEGWIFCSYKSNYLFSLSGLPGSSGPYRICTNCPYRESFFEMRLLNLSINFIVDFCPHLGSFCDRQQLWKAVITGDTVTRLSIPIRGRG